MRVTHVSVVVEFILVGVLRATLSSSGRSISTGKRRGNSTCICHRHKSLLCPSELGDKLWNTTCSVCGVYAFSTSTSSASAPAMTAAVASTTSLLEPPRLLLTSPCLLCWDVYVMYGGYIQVVALSCVWINGERRKLLHYGRLICCQLLDCRCYLHWKCRGCC